MGQPRRRNLAERKRYLVGGTRTSDMGTSIIRIDLETGKWIEILWQDDTLGHLQFNPVHGRDILVQ